MMVGYQIGQDRQATIETLTWQVIATNKNKTHQTASIKHSDFNSTSSDSRTCHLPSEFRGVYPVVNIYIIIENHQFFHGKINYFYGHVQ